MFKKNRKLFACLLFAALLVTALSPLALAEDGEGGTPVLKAPPSAPKVTLNITTEMLSKLTSAMEYKVTDSEDAEESGEYKPVTEELIEEGVSGLIDDVAAGTTHRLSIRLQQTETHQASKVKNITLYPRAQEPVCEYDQAKQVITVDITTAQYRLADAKSWVAVKSSSIDAFKLIEAGGSVVEIRNKPQAGRNAASETVEVTLDALADDETELELDLKAEAVTGFTQDDASYEYRLGSGAWKKVPLTETETGFIFDVSDLISNSAKELSIRSQSVGDKIPIFKKKLSARSTAPKTPAFVYNTVPGMAVLTGLTYGEGAQMEYRVANSGAGWTLYDGQDEEGTNGPKMEIPETTKVTYHVRYSYVDNNKIASRTKTLILQPAPKAPSLKLDLNKETIGTMSDKLEYYTSLDSTYITPEGRYLDIGTYLSADTPVTIYVRKKATASTPASAEQVITLPGRSQAPTGEGTPGSISYDPITCLISGVSKDMQYRVEDSDTAWRPFSRDTFDASGLLGKAEVKLEIRYRPSKTDQAASTPLVITLDALPEWTYGATIDFKSETIDGLAPEVDYEYRLGKAKWKDLELNSDGKFELEDILTTSKKTLEIRTKAGQTPASQPQLFELPKRTGSPRSLTVVYNHPEAVGQAVIEGLTLEMEYRLPGGEDAAWTEWKPCEGDPVIIDLPADKKSSCQVRYSYQTTEDDKEEDADRIPASSIKTVSIAAPGKAPSVRAKTTAEGKTTVGTVTTAMEISFDGENYTGITEKSTAYDITGKTMVYIRKAATKTAPASQPKIIEIK